MNSCKTEQEYINAIAPSVQKCCKRYGYLPSVLIAQSCLENGYAIESYADNSTLYLLIKYNNMVGIKSELLSSSWSDKTVWPGESLTKQTPETYNGKNVIITDNFRKYDNIEQSFADFLLFIKYASNYGKGGKPKYGDEVLSIKDPQKLITEVRNRGYATGLTYITNVMKILNKHNLTKYDDLSNVEPTIYTPGYKGNSSTNKAESYESITINKKYITTHNTNDTNNPIAIVIHNTDNFNKGATAYAHAQALHAGDISGMSWHYAVDDSSIYQCVAHNRGAWHVGKNYGGSNLFGTINNRNSIGIEMCVNAGYDYEKAFQNTVKLTKYLMKTLGIPASKVYTHKDICSKDCPSQILKRNDWSRFKKLISDSGSSVDDTPTENCLQKGDKGTAVKTMQTMLIACGYDCGSTGADGDFGKNTLNALKAFQKASGLTVDGKYKGKDKNALEKAYKAQKDTSKAVNVFLKAVKNVADTAKAKGWHYGDSHAIPPCSDKTISCDRLPARALYDLGYTDQPSGGIVCSNIPTYLYKWGFIGTKKKSEVKAGAIVAVGNGDEIEHIFVVESYNPSTDLCRKYDAGSDERIRHGCGRYFHRYGAGIRDCLLPHGISGEPALRPLRRNGPERLLRLHRCHRNGLLMADGSDRRLRRRPDLRRSFADQCA